MPPKKKEAKGGKKKKPKKGAAGGMDAFHKYLQEIHFVGPQDRERLAGQCRKKVRATFSICQGDREGLCDVRELGNVMRALGFNPSVAQLQLIQPLVVDETNANVELGKLEPFMVDLMLSNEIKIPVPLPDGTSITSNVVIHRHTEREIQQAFDLLWELHGRKLDQDKQRYIEADQLRALLTRPGNVEAFDDAEVTEFMNCAADPDTGFIKEDLFSLLAVE